MLIKTQFFQGTLLILTLLLGACSHHGAHKPSSRAHGHHHDEAKNDGDGPPEIDMDVAHIPNAEPRLEPLSRYGNPQKYDVFGVRYHTLAHSNGYAAEGTASWYGRKFHGQRTSSGEPYDMFGMTAAHRSLPLPTYAKVKNLNNGREVIVKINDRGPFVKDRLIDLSYAAAKKLGIHATGTGKVRITAIDPIAWHKEKEKVIQVASSSKKASSAKHADKKGKATQLAQANTAKNSTNKKAPAKDASKNTSKTATAAKAKTTTVAKANNKQIYLQLGAFSQKTNAQQLANKATVLTQALQDVDVHVLDSKSANKNSYKVRIGPLKSEAEAQKIQKKLIALNTTNPAKVVYE